MRGFMTEEEKAAAPKMTKGLLKRVFSYLVPYWKQLLLVLLAVSIALTYLIPKGEFGVLPDGEPNYLDYVSRSDLGGIPLRQGLLAPVLVFFSSDGLTLIMLSPCRRQARTSISLLSLPDSSSTPLM